MKNPVVISIGCLIAMVFSGCATHEIQDEKRVNSSIISGYLNEKGNRDSNCIGGSCTEQTEQFGSPPSTGKSEYERERDKKLANLVKTPPTPMRVPDTVLRVLVLPYVDDTGALTAQNYKFAKVDDGKWILGEYLVKEGSSVKMLTPLTSETSSGEETKQTEQTQPQPQSGYPGTQMYPVGGAAQGGEQ